MYVPMYLILQIWHHKNTGWHKSNFKEIKLKQCPLLSYMAQNYWTNMTTKYNFYTRIKIFGGHTVCSRNFELQNQCQKYNLHCTIDKVSFNKISYNTHQKLYKAIVATVMYIRKRRPLDKNTISYIAHWGGNFITVNGCLLLKWRDLGKTNILFLSDHIKGNKRNC